MIDTHWLQLVPGIQKTEVLGPATISYPLRTIADTCILSLKSFVRRSEKDALFDCGMQIDDAEAQNTGLHEGLIRV